ncbi:hypothetical protein PHYBOEH_004507 [Phytophthora boehmeriae]|uniref:RxLR effector protein n=1 Tax=Phytophthora boehmeriae TaxID=109152 RepID=A0A8T1WSL6_9STRA|nr:hypothetical protein PHYBOEH_004507 [Phytophthora boehmeriae]
MRACYLFLAIVATVLTSADATVSVTADSKQNKIVKAVSSPDTAPSTFSLTDRDNNSLRNRALRGTDTDDLNDLGSLDDLDDDSDESKEERVGGTSIVKSIHNIKDYQDAKMLRQIAKGNHPEHIFTKFGIPYQVVNGYRVYPNYNTEYQRYLKWLKYHQEK